MKRLSSKNGLVLAGWCSGIVVLNDILTELDKIKICVWEQRSGFVHSIYVWPDNHNIVSRIITRIKAQHRQTKKGVL